jgi:hypothetical protein
VATVTSVQNLAGRLAYLEKQDQLRVSEICRSGIACLMCACEMVDAVLSLNGLILEGITLTLEFLICQTLLDGAFEPTFGSLFSFS